jgi:hypothetical protein
MRFRKIGLVVIVLAAAVVGAHSLNPRELYHEMYPLEPVKRHAFNICDEADPTFIRAVGTSREACYSSMPHVMKVAMGFVVPGDTLSMQALTDPSREAEMLMTLAATPPRQPITEPRLFSNTAWVRALSPCDDDKRAVPPVSYTAPGRFLPAPGGGRAAAIDSAIRNNLPALPHPSQAGIAQRAPLPVLPLAQGQAASSLPSAGGDKIAAANPLPAPDIGDEAPPAIVPLTPASTCGGA